MNAVFEGLKTLGAARLVALGAVGLGMLVMLGLLAMRGGAPFRQALLYADLDMHEASQMAEALDRSHIAHEESPQGDRIMVGSADVAKARMLLAKDGLPSGGSIGYEIFDRGDAMTSSQFQQEINETRALEGELARSIRMLQGIRGARVHLVLPKRQPFSRDVQAAQASVMLTMAGAARMDQQGIQAILNLVAAAVPGLKPQGIAIIDSHGNLLARAGQPTGGDEMTQTGEELRRATELRLSRAVEEMLEQSLGAGRVRAEAAVQMTFDRINETNESYNPDQQVVRSTQTTSDNNKSNEGEKSVSVQNNLPNADAGQSQTGSQQQRQEETTNYEIGKTVRTLLREQPQIGRISLAVMIDGVVQADAAGKAVWAERKPDEIDRIKRLVQSAIGYDAKRGDTVEVISMRFAQPDEAPATTASGLLGFGLEKADYINLGQSAILAVVVLLALLFVLRPMAMRLSAVPQNTLLANGGGLLADGTPMSLSTAQVQGPSSTAGLIADESMVNVANIEGQLRASSIRKLAELVEKHPEESLTIMRGWMTQEQG